MLNETHDASRLSWVESANDLETDFPLQNLSLGAFRARGDTEPRCGIAIGDYVFSPSRHLDLYSDLGRAAAGACSSPDLNALMALGPSAWSALRLETFRMLAASDSRRAAIEPTLLPRASAELLLPVRIGNFTDFFSSIFHAENAGRIFRPDNPLLPNYKYVPVAYHGRASSICAGGGAVTRPRGQIRTAENPPTPLYAPTAQLDFEAELGMFIGVPSELGDPIAVGAARRHIFGLCILNDWSARDIQAWEAQPLGPFLGKSFATTISPWVVTLEALEPFRAPVSERPAGDPPPLPHLHDEEDQARGGFSIAIETSIRTPAMIADGSPPARVSRGSFADTYWSLAQMIAHHTSNGCNLEVGDLIGSGTISGPLPDSWGSLLERTEGGRKSFRIRDGEVRTYLMDGDEVVMKARCERPGYRSVGFGECRNNVVAAGQERPADGPPPSSPLATGEYEAISFNLNGATTTIRLSPDTSLLSALRGPLGLLGSRFGCGTGHCGACNVLLDGRAVTSCDLPLQAIAGRNVTTIEGLGNSRAPHPLQTAFIAEQAMQCGYCVSGILIGAAALLSENPDPTEAEVRSALDRNLCRCGTHNRMVRAVLRAAAESAAPAEKAPA